MSNVVLDASALLALLNQETGSGTVAAAVREGTAIDVAWQKLRVGVEVRLAR